MERGGQTRGKYIYSHSGLVQLRKAINLLDFIISNEAIESVKEAYTNKQKELKKRLEDREQNKESIGRTLIIQLTTPVAVVAGTRETQTITRTTN